MTRSPEEEVYVISLRSSTSSLTPSMFSVILFSNPGAVTVSTLPDTLITRELPSFLVEIRKNVMV